MFRRLAAIILLSGAVLAPFDTGYAYDSLSVTDVGPYSVELLWTAPGDDLDVGQASTYDIRFSEDSITEGSFASCAAVPFPPAPLMAGEVQTAVLFVPTYDTKYYFAIKTADEVFNWSEISSVISATSAPLADSSNSSILFSNQSVDKITPVSATLIWETDLPAISQVVYGINTFEYVTNPSQSLVTSHSVTLSNLIPDQTYMAQAISTDAQGNANGGDIQVFATTGFSTYSPDSPPVAEAHPTYQSLQPHLVILNINSNAENVYSFEVSADTSFAALIDQSPGIPQQIGTRTGWQIETVLIAGEVYYWRANANGGDYGPAQGFVVEPVPYAFPNPFYVNQVDVATFVNVPIGSSLRILSISGDLVKQWTDIDGGTVEWDGTDGAGQPVASEKYLWYIGGTDISGKIILIR